MIHQVDEENLEQVNITALRPVKILQIDAPPETRVLEAVPRACQTCGADACYGRGPVWACTDCWLTLGFGRIPWPTSG